MATKGEAVLRPWGGAESTIVVGVSRPDGIEWEDRDADAHHSKDIARPEPSRGSRYSPLDRRSGWERRAGEVNRKVDQIRAAWVAAAPRYGASTEAAFEAEISHQPGWQSSPTTAC